ncbi:hypothetical protein D3C75_1310880 [compost metagenome]
MDHALVGTGVAIFDGDFQMSVQEFVATFEDVLLDRIANCSPVFGQPSNSVWRFT